MLLLQKRNKEFEMLAYTHSSQITCSSPTSFLHKVIVSANNKTKTIFTAIRDQRLPSLRKGTNKKPILRSYKPLSDDEGKYNIP